MSQGSSSKQSLKTSTEVRRLLAAVTLIPAVALLLITLLPWSILRVVNDSEAQRTFTTCFGRDCREARFGPHEAKWHFGGGQDDESVTVLGAESCKGYYRSGGSVGLYIYRIDTDCRSHAWRTHQKFSLVMFALAALAWLLTFGKSFQRSAL